MNGITNHKDKKQITKGFKLFKYLTKEQVDIILDKARNDNKRNYLILLTLWRTGIRNSELIHLTKRDIDIKQGQIIIRQGKGHKDRMIPLDKNLGDLLSYHSTDKGLDDKLFPLSDMSIRNITHKYQGELDVHPHTFRHSFAVHSLKSGINIRTLQKILGHSDLNTTVQYLDLIGEDIKQDFKKVKFE